jgi:hypothetical protein
MPQPASTKSAPPPTYGDVVHLVGDLDETTVTAIVATGASYVDIETAVKWATGDAEQLDKSHRDMSREAKAVYDILIADPAYAAETER